MDLDHSGPEFIYLGQLTARSGELLLAIPYEPGDVKPQLKGKIKNMLESGLSYALTVRKYFNKMKHYSLHMVPEIPGILTGIVFGVVKHI